MFLLLVWAILLFTCLQPEKKQATATVLYDILEDDGVYCFEKLLEFIKKKQAVRKLGKDANGDDGVYCFEKLLEFIKKKQAVRKLGKDANGGKRVYCFEKPLEFKKKKQAVRKLGKDANGGKSQGCMCRKERSKLVIAINPDRTWGMLRMLRTLELNGLFTTALGLMYYDLLNKDLPPFFSFSRNFWNRVWNSLFNSVSVFWLPQIESNFGVSWKTGKRDEHFVFGNTIYSMVLVFASLNVVFAVTVSIICGSGFPSCQISPDSSRRETQITRNNGNCHGSFARMHCQGGNMDVSFELGRAVALHQNPVNCHSNLFNIEDSIQNKEVKMFDPQNQLKLANDVESNPGPPCMCTIQEFLNGNHEYRSQNKEKLLQAVSKLDKDAKEGKIQACMYTEQNLITLYNIFDVSIREKYPQKIMTEIEHLSNHWNKEVRQEELRLRSERKERSELVIAINRDETTERENADNKTEQQVLQGQMTEQRKPKDGKRKGKQYKMKTSLVKKNRLHRGDWNPYGPKKNLGLSLSGEPPI